MPRRKAAYEGSWSHVFKIRFVGLDVHADTIAVAVAEPDEEVPPLGIIPNRLESVRKLVAKLGPAKQLKAEEFTSENAEMLAAVDFDPEADPGSVDLDHRSWW